MAPPKRPWFRFYTEALTDPKLRRLTPEQRWVWVAVLGAARQSPEPGRLMLSADLPMESVDLAELAGVPAKKVSAALTAMERLRLVERDGEVWVVPKFGARQYESDLSTGRVSRHRSNTDDATSMKRPIAVDETPPETETENRDREQTKEPPATADADASPPDGGTPPDEGIKTDPEIIDELCALLADRIEHHREGDRPKITKTWRKDLDLLLRRGPTDVDPPAPISPEKLRVSIDALFGPLAARDSSGFCWADQVQSPGALRKHWTRIGQAARAKRQTSGGSVEDLAERARKRAAADEAMRRASRRADRANPLAEALGGER